MPACDRHRRPQLVRRIVEEPLLPLEQRRAYVRDGLHLSHRRLSPAGMPDHGEEHRRHERHLEELAPQLDALERVREDARTRRDDDRSEDDAGDAGAPDAEAVDDRQADPDEVERDRLPGRPRDHRHPVGDREEAPQDLYRVRCEGSFQAFESSSTDGRAGDPRVLTRRRQAAPRPQPAGSQHGGWSRCGRRARASAADAARRRRRRSSRGRSRIPTRLRAGARG